MSTERRWTLTLRALACMAVSAVFLACVAQYAAADSAIILPDDLYVTEKTGVSAGTILKWDWQATDSVVFSISPVSDTGDILYRKEGPFNTGEFTVPKDDTYLFTWYNPNNYSVDLTFTVTVAPNAGSILLVILLLIPFIIAIVFVVLYIRKKGTSERTKRQDVSPPVAPQGTGPIPPPAGAPGPVPQVLPPPPPPTLVQRGIDYCPNCGSKVAHESAFCGNCGFRLSRF